MKLMKRLLQLIRLLNINIILLKNRLDQVIFATKGLQQFSFISYFNPWHWFNKEHKSRGESIRLVLEELGPLFVKFGQIVSTRRDLLPDDIADELEKLQDRVPPFPGTLAKSLIEEHYQKPVEEVFTAFEEVPLASASIAQVHAATLKNGCQVVVKIVRPNIERVIYNDIGLMYSAAALTEKFIPHGKKLRPREVVGELERSLSYELDLLHEGANASQLRRNFYNSTLLYVPKVFWEYSSHKILVMERIKGIPISNIEALKYQGVNLRCLAEKGVEIFFTQMLRDGFFHADMHPGNIFVNIKHPQDPQYIAVDFGIMGTLSPLDQRYLAENLLAFFRRDYRKVAELHIEPANSVDKVRIDEFETAIRGACEPIFERPLKDISIGKLLLKIFQAAREFHLQVKPQFFLLQKTLLNIEGLGKQLYPELDLWSTAKPYVEKWIQEQIGPRAIFNKIYQRAPFWLDKIIDFPDKVESYVQKIDAVNKSIYSSQDTNQQKRLKQKKRQGIGLGLVIMAIINYIMFHATSHNHSLLNLIIGIVGFLLILFNL
jgi:ubiquinone biosynthesis protein